VAPLSEAVLYGESIVPVREFVLSGATGAGMFRFAFSLRMWLRLDIFVSADYYLKFREPGSAKTKLGSLAITLETSESFSKPVAPSELSHSSGSSADSGSHIAQDHLSASSSNESGDDLSLSDQREFPNEPEDHGASQLSPKHVKVSTSRNALRIAERNFIQAWYYLSSYHLFIIS
jgi:hypothetical protein